MDRKLDSELHIWEVDVDYHSYRKYKKCINILSCEESNKLLNLRVQKSKWEFVISRLALKILLSKYTGINVYNIDLSYNKYGKPFIKNNPLYFNLSHSNKKTVIVFCNEEVGVDLEYIIKEITINDIAPLVLSSREQNMLLGVTGLSKIRKFFEIWTKKEALLKAMGVGLGAYDLTSLEYEMSACFEEQNNALILNKWNLKLVDLQTTDYICHVCYAYNQMKTIIYNKFILD